MAHDGENDFRPGDLENVILRKILARLGEAHDAIVNIPSITSETPTFSASQLGVVNGKAARVFHIIARRAGFNSTTVLQDVAEFLGTSINAMPELTGAESLEIVSSSGSDAVDGTGTRSVKVTYIDSDYGLVTSSAISLSGTTPVAAGFTARQIISMEAFSVGTNTVSVGTIILRIVGPGATHEQITAGGNKSLSSHFMVPDGYSAYIAEWHVSATGTATQDARLRATTQTGDRSLGTAYILQDNTFASANANSAGILPWLRFPARSRLKVSTISSVAAATNRIDADYSILLVAD